MDPAELLADPETLRRIEVACQRRFPFGDEADECYVFVLQGLQDNDFARLRRFKGNSKFSTYLYSVTQALIYDFQRKRYGRKRIPKAVRLLGAWAEAVYRLICWRRCTLDEAFDVVSIQGVYQGSYQEFIGEVAPVQEAPCQENPRFESMEQRAEAGREQADSSASPFDRLLAKLDHERKMLAAKVIREATAEMSPKDQLMVQLVYGADRSAAAAGRAVGLNPPQARRRLKSILFTLRARLLEVGVREA